MDITSSEIAAVAYRDRNWTWDDVVNDPVLSRLPFQIELDKYGRLLMSPAANWYHAKIQSRLVVWLTEKLGGQAISEVAVSLAGGGTYEPDVVWASAAYWSALSRDRAELPNCPPLAIEVLSKSNTPAEMRDKIDAYLASGAQEVWLVAQNGHAEFFTAQGEQPRSSLANCSAADLTLVIVA